MKKDNPNDNGITNKKTKTLTPEEARKRFLATLGLARRAGKVACGTQNVCDALKCRKVSLVIEAEGNSENTHKRLSDRCAYYEIELVKVCVTADELGAAMGRGGAISAAAVTDPSLAEAVRRALPKTSEPDL